MTSAWGLTAAYLCSAQALTGQLHDARDSACQAQPVLKSLGLEGLLFIHVAVLCARTGRPLEAARLLGCSQAWYATNHNAPDSTMLRLHGMVEAEAEAKIGGSEFQRLRAEGAAMPADEVVALVLALISAAHAR
jgi:hypothetical protein